MRFKYLRQDSTNLLRWVISRKNDIELLEATKEGRNINRHYYDLAEIEEEVQRPVIQQLFALLKFRNESAAFDLDGTIEVATPSESEIVITRKNKTVVIVQH